MPVSGVNTVVQKDCDSAEPLAKRNSKRVRFDLQEFGEEPDQGGVAETQASADAGRRSSEDELLRRESPSGARPSYVTPSRVTMQHTGNPPEANPSRHAASKNLPLTPERTEAAPQASADQARLPETGLRHL